MAAARQTAVEVAAAAQRHGLFVRVAGTAVAVCPPLVIDDVELDELFRRLRLAIEEVALGPPSIP